VLAVSRLRVDRHLQHAVAAVAEQVVGLDDVVEREVVGDERERVETTRFDGRDEPSQSLLAARVVVLAGEEGFEPSIS